MNEPAGTKSTRLKIKEIGDFLSTDPHKAENNSGRKMSGKAD